MSASEEPTSRTRIVRDVLIFQAKLWLEGFKDIVLMPLSLGAAVIAVLFRGSGRDTLYAVMRLGDRFERWVHSMPRWRTIPRRRRRRATAVRSTVC
ncbi:MAG: hypothetical protein ABEK84_07695 [Salinibacter sp.]